MNELTVLVPASLVGVTRVGGSELGQFASMHYE